MANRVSSEDILHMNEIYYQTHVFAEVARQTGFSASTVRKYVDTNWKPVEAENVVKFDMAQLPNFDIRAFNGLENFGELCVLSLQEKEEIMRLWKEMVI